MPTSKSPDGGAGRVRGAPRASGRRFLTPDDVERIRALILAWPALPLTWEDVRRRVARDIQKIGDGADERRKLGSDGKGWTRQALSRHRLIQEAYDRRTKELQAERERVARNPGRNRDPEVVLLRRERDTIRRENDELRRKLAAYEERFSTLIYNKALGAQTEEQLQRELPKKFDRRGRT